MPFVRSMSGLLTNVVRQQGQSLRSPTQILRVAGTGSSHMMLQTTRPSTIPRPGSGGTHIVAALRQASRLSSGLRLAAINTPSSPYEQIMMTSPASLSLTARVTGMVHSSSFTVRTQNNQGGGAGQGAAGQSGGATGGTNQTDGANQGAAGQSGGATGGTQQTGTVETTTTTTTTLNTHRERKVTTSVETTTTDHSVDQPTQAGAAQAPAGAASTGTADTGTAGDPQTQLVETTTTTTVTQHSHRVRTETTSIETTETTHTTGSDGADQPSTSSAPAPAPAPAFAPAVAVTLRPVTPVRLQRTTEITTTTTTTAPTMRLSVQILIPDTSTQKRLEAVVRAEEARRGGTPLSPEEQAKLDEAKAMGMCEEPSSTGTGSTQMRSTVLTARGMTGQMQTLTGTTHAELRQSAQSILTDSGVTTRARAVMMSYLDRGLSDVQSSSDSSGASGSSTDDSKKD